MLQLNPSEVERLQDLVQRVALGKTDAQRLMRNVSQPGSRKRAHSPQVQFDSEACATATLVEIVADDRPGLLYSLAMVFSSSACNIDTVLIDTKGHRAIDVFYVARDGRKLSAELQTMLKEKLMRESWRPEYFRAGPQRRLHLSCGGIGAPYNVFCESHPVCR